MQADDLRIKVHKILDRVGYLNQKEISDAECPDLQKNAQKIAKQILKEESIDDNLYKERILDELFDCGPLKPLIKDKSVTEILINGRQCIWYEKFGKFFRLEDEFVTEKTYKNFIHRICIDIKKFFDLKRPQIDGSWLNFRVHIIAPPIANTIHISMRRHPKNPWSLEELHRVGWCDKSNLEFLKRLVKNQSNCLIIGTTGSGKTSILGALLKEIQKKERAIILEDVSEIFVPNSLSLKLLTRNETIGSMEQYSLSDLVRQSLRMRPERLIMGEIRGKEAKDLLLMLSCGHRGSLSTLHAASAKESLLRLEVLTQMGAAQWSLYTIRQLIRMSIDYIIMVEKDCELRYLKSIHKISSLESNGFTLQTIYSKKGIQS